MAKLPRTPCVGCGVLIRRVGSWGACPACYRLVTAYVRRTVGAHNPTTWIAALNAAHGDRERFTEIARAERVS